MRVVSRTGSAVRRGAVAACLTLLVLFMLIVPVRAQDGLSETIAQETQHLLDRMNLEEIERQVPELDVVQLLRDTANGTLSLDGELLLQGLRSMLLEDLQALLPRVLRIIGVSVLCAGLMQLRSVAAQDGLTQLMETLAYLSLALPIAKDCTALFSQGKEVTGRMVEFYQTILPTMLTLLTAIGGEHSALVLQETSIAVTGGLTQVMQGALLGALGFGAALAVTNHVAPEICLGRAFKALRTGIHWALGLCFTIFLGLITVQGSTAAHYDGVTVRTAKYAVDKFVPVVGGAFKETADTLIGCSIVVKNAVGVVGLAGILLIVLKPCVGILGTVAVYKLCAAALESLGCTRIVSALSDFADILTTLFIIIISIGAMFFVFLAELMRIGMGFV